MAAAAAFFVDTTLPDTHVATHALPAVSFALKGDQQLGAPRTERAGQSWQAPRRRLEGRAQRSS